MPADPVRGAAYLRPEQHPLWVHFFVAPAFVCQFGLGTLTSKGPLFTLNGGQE